MHRARATATIDAETTAHLPRKEHSMPLRPKTPIDLSLAPVAAQLDMNIERLRDCSPEEIDFEIALELDRPERSGTVQERADRVLAVALRNVELHGWTASISDDHCRLHLSGGSVTLDIGLSAQLMRYIEAAPVAASAPAEQVS
jgi:hypothetical protein